MTTLTYTRRVLPLFTFSLFITSLGAFIGSQFLYIIVHPWVMFTLSIIEFILLVTSFGAKRRREVGRVLMYSFVFLTGLLISPIIAFYVYSAGAGIVVQALIITSIIFASLSLYAYMTGSSFTRLGGFLFVSLISVIIVSLLNIFIKSTTIFVVIDMATILIFSGYILYDTGRILNELSDDDVYTAVLSLYIDFLNIFINILELLGLFERRD